MEAMNINDGIEGDVEFTLTTDRLLILVNKRNEMASQLKVLYPAEMPKYLQEVYDVLDEVFINAIQAEAKYLLSINSDVTLKPKVHLSFGDSQEA